MFRQCRGQKVDVWLGTSPARRHSGPESYQQCHTWTMNCLFRRESIEVSQVRLTACLHRCSSFKLQLWLSPELPNMHSTAPLKLLPLSPSLLSSCGCDNYRNEVDSACTVRIFRPFLLFDSFRGRPSRNNGMRECGNLCLDVWSLTVRQRLSTSTGLQWHRLDASQLHQHFCTNQLELPEHEHQWTLCGWCRGLDEINDRRVREHGDHQMLLLSATATQYWWGCIEEVYEANCDPDR